MVVAMEQDKEMVSQPASHVSSEKAWNGKTMRTRYNDTAKTGKLVGEVAGEGIAYECYSIDRYSLAL